MGANWFCDVVGFVGGAPVGVEVEVAVVPIAGGPPNGFSARLPPPLPPELHSPESFELPEPSDKSLDDPDAGLPKTRGAVDDDDFTGPAGRELFVFGDGFFALGRSAIVRTFWEDAGLLEGGPTNRDGIAAALLLTAAPPDFEDPP